MHVATSNQNLRGPTRQEFLEPSNTCVGAQQVRSQRFCFKENNTQRGITLKGYGSSSLPPNTYQDPVHNQDQKRVRQLVLAAFEKCQSCLWRFFIFFLFSPTDK
jgi:hypothetical protein